MEKNMSIEKQTVIKEYWEKYLNKTGAQLELSGDFMFGWDERVATMCLNLVLTGKKTGTCGSLLAYQIEGTPLPKVGEYFIITDWLGTPRCIIETIEVIVKPFQDMTENFTILEGEGDHMEWQRGHRNFFITEGKQLGYKFTEDMPIVFEVFRVVEQ
jgi:uncharacterized protein YhfF